MAALNLDFKKRHTAFYAKASAHSKNLNDQLRDLQIFCLRNYLTNTELYTDSHIRCTKNQARPEFTKMIRSIESGEIECLVVCSIASLARSSSDFFKCLEILRKYQVGLVAIEENFSFDPSSAAVSQLISVVSRFERDQFKEKVRSGIKRAQAQGRPIGRSRLRNDTLIQSLLNSGLSIREAARVANCSPSTVAAVKKTRS